jgi:sialate O-acetylesterase
MSTSVLGLLLALSLPSTARPAEARTLGMAPAAPGEGSSAEMIVDLSGDWRFEVGDEPAWSARQFDDSRWERVRFPGQWEDQGFPGYDGFAWARKSFRITGRNSGRALDLRFGNVDDVDEVYLNGILIGYTGSFPPHYQTAYSQHRRYPIPPDLIRWGEENVIAVRIYDGEMGGGIANGPIGIFSDPRSLAVQYPLLPLSPGGAAKDARESPVWRFSTGDRKEWLDPKFDDSRWKPTVVPLLWDAQGLKDYDGFAWYRVRFRVPNFDATRPIILVLGRIDDVDEVYLNGSLIGRTGRMPPEWEQGEAYQQLRAYTIPAGRLQPGSEAVLAIRVYDGLLHGGIYDGPIGFVTRERYVAWARESRPKTTVLHRLMEFFWGDDAPYEPRPPESGWEPHW